MLVLQKGHATNNGEGTRRLGFESCDGSVWAAQDARVGRLRHSSGLSLPIRRYDDTMLSRLAEGSCSRALRKCRLEAGKHWQAFDCRQESIVAHVVNRTWDLQYSSLSWQDLSFRLVMLFAPAGFQQLLSTNSCTLLTGLAGLAGTFSAPVGTGAARKMRG